MLQNLWKLALLVLITASAPSVPSAFAQSSISAIATNASYHSRRTFGTGLYVASVNKTFISYSGPEMDVYVKAYDHATNAWGASIKVFDWNDSTQFAYHDYPTMVLLPDGRLGIFICDHAKAAYLIKAPAARSIGGTWTRTRISSDLNAYPMPVVVGSTTYFFYSKDAERSWPYRTYRLIKSADSGASWTGPKTVIDTGKTADKFNEVYAFGYYATSNRIYISFTLAGGPGGHNHKSRNLYLSYMNLTTENMHNVAGANLASVVDSADLQSVLVLASPPAASGTYFQLHPISYSQPIVVDDGTTYVAFGEWSSTGDRIRLGRHSSGSWSFSNADTTTAIFMDATKSGASDIELVYSTSDQTMVKSRKTSNGGATWTNVFAHSIPYGSTNADRANYANYIMGRSTISIVGGTYNTATRQSGVGVDPLWWTGCGLGLLGQVMLPPFIFER